MDSISNLPDELIRHIGSYLSAKEVAFTTVLSKRWQNLITIVQDVGFDGSLSGRGSLKDFVDGVLALPPSSRIRSFSIDWRVVPLDQYVLVNRCLCDVLKRGVLVLELKTKVEEEGYELPLEVFTCKTVEKLTLGCGFVIDILPNNASLPALRTLVLDSVRFYYFGGRCAFTMLLSASPLLEELVMVGIEWERWEWSCTLSSLTLRRLTIQREVWQPYADDDSQDEIVRLDSRGLAYDFDYIIFHLPGLTYFEYYDYVPKEYPIVNLNSLVEAKLTLCADENGVWETIHADDFNPTNLINALKNVEILDLNFETVEMFGVFPEAMPVFEKLLRLSVNLSTYCWSPLIMLIKKSPNLKTLIIEGSLHYGLRQDQLVCECVSEYSFLLSCPVEVLEVTNYDGSMEELEQFKHLLGKLSCLKLVKVWAQVPADREKQVVEDLLQFDQASSKCKIEVMLK